MAQQREASAFRSRDVVVAAIHGLCCHLAFAAAVGTMIVVLFSGMCRAEGRLAGPLAGIANAALLLQFPVLHSALLSRRGQSILKRLAPFGLGRRLASTTYALIASLQTLALFLAWTPSRHVLWRAGPGLFEIVGVANALAWLLLAKAIADAGFALQTGLLGRRAVASATELVYPPMPTRGLFRFVRQPIYLAFALTLWTVPTITPDGLAVAIVLTGYCLIGSLFKEGALRPPLRGTLPAVPCNGALLAAPSPLVGRLKSTASDRPRIRINPSPACSPGRSHASRRVRSMPSIWITPLPSVALVAVETAVPSHVIDQADAAAFARSAFAGRHEDFPRLANVFATAGIRTRQSVRPVAWFEQARDWSERTAVYVEGATALFVEVARKALDAAGITAREIDTVVTVSSTGIATPTLDALAFAALDFRADVRRVPVFGLGCAGGASGLGLAARLAAAEPDTRVLLVVVELCTLSLRIDKPTKSNIVAAALFGDGAAACVVSSGRVEDGATIIEANGEHLWPGTLDIMGWAVDPQGFDVIFSRAIPPFAEANVRAATAAILVRQGLALEDIERFVLHPGGAKVITALERGLALGQGTLQDERAVLAAHGNMSAPTILFVLKRALATGLPNRTMLAAMGPGFTLSTVTLRSAA